MSHDQFLESAAAYALDSLDPIERTDFERHLAGCAECRLAVQEYRDVTGLLVHASEPVAVPPGLRARVGDLVRQERRPTPRRRTTAGWRSSSVWLAAATAAFAVTAGLLWRELDTLRDAALESQRDLTAVTAAHDSLLADVTGPRLHFVSLMGPEGGPPVARVFWNHDRRRFVVTAFRLPPAPAGRTYQLWAIAEGHGPVSMGTFNTDASGVATVTLPVGDAIEALGLIKACGITQEPSGGSRAPTETPRFTGEWRHTD